MWILENDLWRDTDFLFYNLVSTRASGNLREPAARAAFCLRHAIDGSSIVSAEQVHGDRIAVVDRRNQGQTIAGVDALVTQENGLYLSIFTADCLAVFLADTASRAVALVHAGWRGLAGGIIGKAVAVLAREFGAAPKDLCVAIGPHIQKCCFGVGDDVKAAFGLAGSADSHLDLGGICREQLQQAGVLAVSANGHCTCHEDRLCFSYRRDATSNRLMALIGNGPN
jgi:hypothetical protein